jgi:hypothetical protein
MEALTITGAVFAGLGVLLVAIGIVVTRANRRFDRRALPDGREVETIARTGTTFDAMKEGQDVTVLYDPGDPRQARVDSRTAAAGSTAVGIGFIAIGGACVLIGAGLIAAGIALEDALPAVIRS